MDEPQDMSIESIIDKAIRGFAISWQHSVNDLERTNADNECGSFLERFVSISNISPDERGEYETKYDNYKQGEDLQSGYKTDSRDKGGLSTL